ncbi:MAG: phosphate ABC transporter permease PstA [Candidatus Obscuribacterales bacterium]|nr:phosphate ABC transporter permease PstA [Steroidobacteraceae bacterium]
MSAASNLVSTETQHVLKSAKLMDKVFVIAGMCILFASLLTLAILFFDLVRDGAGRFGWDFLSSFPSRKAERAGILSAWVGTCLVMLVTVVVAMPVGVAAAIYLEEYAPKNIWTAIIEINVTNLAGVPSIIYGLLALGLFVYKLDLGQSIVAAGLTLALLILPIVIVASREAIRAVPKTIREAAYGLGATRWEVTKDHVLPYSSGGILTGLIIGMSRAIGETAPIITIGALAFIAFLPTPPLGDQFPYVNFTWLSDPFTVMPIQMFNWVSRPDPAFQVNAAAAGAILLGMTLLMNGIAIYVRYRFRKKINW